MLSDEIFLKKQYASMCFTFCFDKFNKLLNSITFGLKYDQQVVRLKAGVAFNVNHQFNGGYDQTTMGETLAMDVWLFCTDSNVCICSNNRILMTSNIIKIT